MNVLALARLRSPSVECSRRVDLFIDHDWRGEPADVDERVHVALSRAGEPANSADSANSATADLFIEIDAPFHRDPAPPGPSGPTPGLWNFEVVELFLLGASMRYLELEFSPHGHWLALELDGKRNVVRSETSSSVVRYEAERSAYRWCGRARIEGKLLPAGVTRANAYAIHGAAQARKYLAWSPVPGAAPDFHRLDYFAPFDFGGLRVRRSP